MQKTAKEDHYDIVFLCKFQAILSGSKKKGFTDKMFFVLTQLEQVN